MYRKNMNEDNSIVYTGATRNIVYEIDNNNN